MIEGFGTWWASLPGWFRVPVALLVMIAGVPVFLAAPHVGAGRTVRGGMVLGLLILTLGGWLLIREPTESEKRGYHD